MAGFALILVGGLTIAVMAFDDPPVQTKTFVRQFDATTVPFIGEFVEGSSAKLTRSEDAVSIKINTTQLPAGAYTIWAIIFNDPSECTAGTGGFSCGPADVGNALTVPSVLWADGGVVDETGVGHFRGAIEEGMPPGFLIPVGCQCGLVDAENAEIHAIIRYHGPLSEDPVLAELQLTTPGGGCGAGLFACYEPQAVRFPFFGD